MKKEIHPAYQKVLFVDSSSGYRFICGSTQQPKAREVFEGTEYPVVHLSISSSSHSFFTGSKQFVDAEGRVEKFRKRFERKKEEPQGESQEESAKEEAPAVAAKKEPKVAKKK